YEFSNMYVEKKGEVYLRQVIGEGRYFVRATTEDGKAYEWVVETKGSDYVRVPSRYSELEGKNLEKLQLISYILEVHFPKEFSTYGHNLNLDFSRKTLLIDGRKVKIDSFEDTGQSRSHGYSIKVETNLKSTKGAKVVFTFYEDGTVDFYTDGTYLIHSLNIEPGNILVVDYGERSISHQSIIPLEPKELKTNTLIELGELSINVEGKKGIKVSEALKKVFGYDNFKELQEKIKSDDFGLILKFDNGRAAFCRSPEFTIHVPEGAKEIVAVKVWSIRPVSTEEITKKLAERIKFWADQYESAMTQQQRNWYIGKIGEEVTVAKLSEQKEEISKYLGIPPEKLVIEQLGDSGVTDVGIFTSEDLNRPVAIVEVKTTTAKPDEMQVRLSEAVDDLLNKRFNSEYKNVKHGFAVAIYIDEKYINNPEELFKSGTKSYNFVKEYCRNPYYKK
ncbi:MAG: hypothetical protein ACP5KW_12070, partial [Thermoproteota archaeon]